MNFLQSLSMLALFIVANVVAQLGIVQAKSAITVLKGPARVLNGGKLYLDQKVILLKGIHALEKDQACKSKKKLWACGMASTVVLKRLIRKQSVLCQITKRHDENRVTAICHVDGRDIAARMLTRGLVLAKKKSNDIYKQLEAKARINHQGLWASQFIHPDEWRKGKRLANLPDKHPGIRGRTDERFVVNSTDYPWNTIGRIDNGGQSFCTGTLVGPSLVITAAHCLVDKRSKKYFRPQQIHFTAGLRGSRYTAHAIAKQILPSPKFDTTRRTPKDDAMHDWALLVLTEPIGNQFGYLGWRHGDKGRIIDNFKKRTKYVQAGYSQDQQRRLSAHAGCHFNGYLKSARLALHDCDAVSGASGSPIIQIFRGKPQLVGMHVGSIKRDNKNHGGAILSEQFGHALKRFVRAGGGKLPPGKKGRAAKHQIKLLQRRLGAAFPSKSSKLRP